MSDTSQGEGWWKAGDGSWYPPERHPDYIAPLDTVAAPMASPGTSPGHGWWKAGDGQWYPPERHPNYTAPPTTSRPVPFTPPPPPGGFQGAQVSQGTNGLAVGSLIAGLLGCTGFSIPVAIILGHMALSQIKKSGGTQGGKGFAIAGLVLGYLFVAALVAGIVIAAIGSTQPM